MSDKLTVEIKGQRAKPLKIYALRRAGERGFTMSIPSVWVEANGLKTGDTLMWSELVESGQLVLSAIDAEKTP